MLRERCCIERRYIDVLRKICERLKDDVIWALTGSLGHALQGVPVEVHDVDIQTDREGAYEIERRFSEFVVRRVRFSSTDKIRSHFGELRIDGVKVEIMGDVQKRLPDGGWEEPVDVEKHRKFIQVEGMRVPVLKLEYEYRAYLILGRKERAEILERYMCKKGG